MEETDSATTTAAGELSLEEAEAGGFAEDAETGGDQFEGGDCLILDLGRDVDVVLMLQDPPFDVGYITAT